MSRLPLDGISKGGVRIELAVNAYELLPFWDSECLIPKNFNHPLIGFHVGGLS